MLFGPPPSVVSLNFECVFSKNKLRSVDQSAAPADDDERVVK